MDHPNCLSLFYFLLVIIAKYSVQVMGMEVKINAGKHVALQPFFQEKKQNRNREIKEIFLSWSLTVICGVFNQKQSVTHLFDIHKYHIQLSF